MRLVPFLALCGFLLGATPTMALDLQLYADLLKRHTRATDDIASTRVAYAALVDSAAWERLIASLEASRPDALGSRDEKLAFWINAYNVLAIDVVRRSYPVASIRDIGSFFRPVWKRRAGTIGGRDYTLDQIEHEILRPLGEPRIHAAIVCASLSCPPLRREPYSAARLDAQLDQSTRAWLADPRKGARLDRDAGVLHLSAILDWFAEDFAAAGGVRAFVAKHAPPELAADLRARGDDVPVRYIDYDWSLNDVKER